MEMGDDADVLSLKRRAGIAATVIVVLHIVLSVIFMLNPKSASHAGIIGLIYNRLLLIGPFFQESRIKTSPHLYVRAYENSRWSSVRDFAMENNSFFHSHPLRYDRLRMNYFERYISHQVGLLNVPRNYKEIKKSRLFRELNQFVLQEYLKRPVDSLSLVYGVNRYFPETGITEFDTTFAYTYNPCEIGLAKQLY